MIDINENFKKNKKQFIQIDSSVPTKLLTSQPLYILYFLF